MPNAQSDALAQVETTCRSLLHELQIIWDEVGEAEADRDEMLLDLERECLEVYRRKVDQANRSRAQLRQMIADSEAELASIISAMGERPVHIRQPEQNGESLKDELKRVLPQVEEMKKRRCDRRNQFLVVIEQIQAIKNEINGTMLDVSTKPVVDDTDLSLRKLEDLHKQLHELQQEKSDRLKQIQDHVITLHSLCSVLGMDYKETISQVNPTLAESEGSRSISDDTIEHLAAAIQKLREVKIQRMQRLQDLASAMLELWNLMDTPIEEQQEFQNVTCNIAASEDEVTQPNSLSIDFLKYVETEVSRLDELKSSKMKELVLKKRLELDEICRKTHLIPEYDSAMEHVIEAIESGALDPATVLQEIEVQISRVKEEAFSRKDILEKVEKWLGACEEESWLEEYNRDDNRYNAGKGAHLTLKRAEKARALVNKLPGMIEALASKTVAWEQERGIEFLYDGIRVLTMLEQHALLREEKEQERRRQRDQKKIQGQLIAEQEVLYGSKPSPSKPQGKKGPRLSTGGGSSKRLSLGGTTHQTPRPDSRPTTPQSRSSKKSDQFRQNGYSDYRNNDSFAALSTGRRGLDIGGLSAKKQSLGGTYDVEPRKPFSPISKVAPSKSNMSIINVKHGEMMTQKATPASDFSFSTPLKTTTTTIIDVENRTPKAIIPIPTPCTPSTVSVPMQTTMTPAAAPPPPFSLPSCDSVEEIEYSFEERRAGFVLSKS